MHATHLKVFTQIDGIGSTSGLFLKEKLLYIIGDNSANLNEFNISTKQLNKIKIVFNRNSDILENIAKAEKPDFEVLCHYENILYILGSGSTHKRNLMLGFNLKTKAVIQQDLTTTYNKLKFAAGIDNDNFNIEGAIFTGKSWLLFNRGNGQNSKNGIFEIEGKSLFKAEKTRFRRLNLPNINHIESSFTDAVLCKNEIFFIATAENTNSTYNDGAILGSFIGSINLNSLKLNFAVKISNNHKFEGICVLSQSLNQIDFLLCEDRDTEDLKSTIYKLTLKS